MSAKELKYYLIAGEASGDLHASHLMAALKRRNPELQFRGWGGERMEAQGMELVTHYHSMNFMGFFEVAANIRSILGLMRQCKSDLLSYKPDVLVLIDYPGFNLRMAEFAHKHGIRVVYYISPQVWAWKKNRIVKIRKFVDQMLVILPFEKDFYAENGMEVEFVGHPLLDELQSMTFPSRVDFLAQHELDDRPIIALLPGSRSSEIKTLLPTMTSLASHYPNHQLVIAGRTGMEYPPDVCQSVSLVRDHTYALVHHAEVAVVASGTATLETALLGTPQVVGYWMNPISFYLAKSMIQIKYIALVNLICNREVVTELIQNRFTRQHLIREIDQLLEPKRRDHVAAEYAQLRVLLGDGGASERAAGCILGEKEAG